MIAYDYDVLVIGGGPAGSCAAWRTQHEGLRTLVVEKEEFPRFRIGESLLPHGNALLRETGVWPKIEKAGFIDKYGASFYLSNGLAHKEVIFERALVPGLEKTYQVERAKFDAILLDHAREAGAEVRTRATVRSVSVGHEGHRVSLETATGIEEVSARWVIDASGRDQFFPNELKRALDPDLFPKRVAIYSHFSGVRRASGLAAGHTVIVRLADGWFWSIPIDAERTSVGLVTTVAAMREAKMEPAELFRQTVAGSPKLKKMMQGSEPVLGFHVTSDYTYFRQRLAAGRMVLVGDAGGFFDPIFSSGVYMAAYSAKLAAEMIVRAHRAARPLTNGECRRYSNHIKAHAGVFKKLITAFYDNDSFAVFMCRRPPLNLSPAITAIVAGHALLIWPIRWRFYAFLIVCRLQRRFPLVPRINFAGMQPVSPQPRAAS
ncbi:MAG TPA: NAD(P)/FAD-dependent oxidoreductase [Rariglobus sp.]|jgi:flavin-dependent dehydrogenase|nr:NAD(P)/FAD-dependent oxidoreductase [Rariglobus sp.]